MTRLTRFKAVFVSTIIFGCSSSCNIQVVDGSPRKIVPVFDKSIDVTVGDIFEHCQIQRPPSAGSQSGHPGSAGLMVLNKKLGLFR